MESAGIPPEVKPAAAIINAPFGIQSVLSRSVPIQQEFKALPVIVLLGFPRHQDVEELSRVVGACTIVSKPFDNAELEQAICGAIGKQVGTRDSLSRQIA